MPFPAHSPTKSSRALSKSIATPRGWPSSSRQTITSLGSPASFVPAPALEILYGLTHSMVSAPRSEEHTSELQSLMRISYAVFCLKKKKKIRKNISQQTQNNHQHNRQLIYEQR